MCIPSMYVVYLELKCCITFYVNCLRLYICMKYYARKQATLLLLLWNISQGCEQHKVKAPLIPQDKKLTKPFLYFVEIDFHLFCLG